MSSSQCCFSIFYLFVTPTPFLFRTALFPSFLLRTKCWKAFGSNADNYLSMRFSHDATLIPVGWTVNYEFTTATASMFRSDKILFYKYKLPVRERNFPSLTLCSSLSSLRLDKKTNDSSFFVLFEPLHFVGREITKCWDFHYIVLTCHVPFFLAQTILNRLK